MQISVFCIRQRSVPQDRQAEAVLGEGQTSNGRTAHEDKSRLCSRLVHCVPLKHHISTLDLFGKHTLSFQTAHFHADLVSHIALLSSAGPFLTWKLMIKKCDQNAASDKQNLISIHKVSFWLLLMHPPVFVIDRFSPFFKNIRGIIQRLQNGVPKKSLLRSNRKSDAV